jgi:hypothetical protein
LARRSSCRFFCSKQLTQDLAESEAHTLHIFATARINVTCVMTQDERSKDPFLRDPFLQDLQSALHRDLPPAEMAQSYSRLRLQPVAVPPPPVEGHDRRRDDAVAASASATVSADDDLPLDETLEPASRLRWPLIIAATVVASGAGALGFLMFSLSYSPPDSVAVPRAIPEILADPNAVAKAPPVRSETVAGPAASPQPVSVGQVSVGQVSVGQVSMGQVSTDLIAPSTEGLTPARKIGTIRILVEGDKEIGTLR